MVNESIMCSIHTVVCHAMSFSFLPCSPPKLRKNNNNLGNRLIFSIIQTKSIQAKNWLLTRYTTWEMGTEETHDHTVAICNAHRYIAIVLILGLI